MSEPRLRPESFDDLTKSMTEPVVLAQIILDNFAIGGGLLRAADEFVGFYNALYAEKLDVVVEGNTIVVARQRTEGELAEALATAQADWDKQNQLQIDADTRG